MELKPVKKYKEPAYPDKRKVMEHPSILKTVPGRWKGNIRVGITLTYLLSMTMVGCSQQHVGNNPSGEQEVNIIDKEDNRDSETQSVPRVAPIFIHGDGRGSFGCVSVAPPAFLSEEEAFDVIHEEAKNMVL